MAPPKIKKAKNFEQLLKVLVYGDPGVGKTTLAGGANTHPDTGPVLVANIEGGVLSLADTECDTTEQLRTTAEVEEVLWALSHGADGFGKYKTLVVDSATELQTIDLEGIVAASLKKNKKQDRTQDDIFLEDYGKSTARLKRVFRHMKDLPMHVIVTALTKTEMPANAHKMTNPQPKNVGPALTSKLANSLMGYMDSVWYMYTEEVEGGGTDRCLLTQKHGVYQAKTRGQNFSRELGSVVRNPKPSGDFQSPYQNRNQQRKESMTNPFGKTRS